MSLEFVLGKLKKKAVWRIVLYGLFALIFLDDRVRLFGLICVIMVIRWSLRLSDIQKYPEFLKALNGRETVHTKDLAKKLGLTKDTLGRKIKRLKNMDLIPKGAIFEKNGSFVLLGLQSHPMSFWMNGAWPNEIKPEQKEKKEAQKPADDDYLDGHPIKCPSCGAESIVKKGRTIKCPYCGRGLRVQDK